MWVSESRVLETSSASSDLEAARSQMHAEGLAGCGGPGSLGLWANCSSLSADQEVDMDVQ